MVVCGRVFSKALALGGSCSLLWWRDVGIDEELAEVMSVLLNVKAQCASEVNGVVSGIRHR